nr:septin and tuftelin-interacting protein 1 homolog 1-like [Ipomoea batatas]GME07485.1 septin and tuftelin-interacting protein 1 homolog 1-like [Ipomoea batatas]
MKQASKKKVCITAEELLLAKKKQQQHVVQKVFDMRGPQVRVLTNLKNLNGTEEKATENDILMPERQHSIRLIVDLEEFDIQNRDLRNERETVNSLQKETEKLQAEDVHKKKHVENMEDIMNELDRIDEESKEGTL